MISAVVMVTLCKFQYARERLYISGSLPHCFQGASVLFLWAPHCFWLAHLLYCTPPFIFVCLLLLLSLVEDWYLMAIVNIKIWGWVLTIFDQGTQLVDLHYCVNWLTPSTPVQSHLVSNDCVSPHRETSFILWYGQATAALSERSGQKLCILEVPV